MFQPYGEEHQASSHRGAFTGCRVLMNSSMLSKQSSELQCFVCKRFHLNRINSHLRGVSEAPIAEQKAQIITFVIGLPRSTKQVRCFNRTDGGTVCGSELRQNNLKSFIFFRVWLLSFIKPFVYFRRVEWWWLYYCIFSHKNTDEMMIKSHY